MKQKIILRDYLSTDFGQVDALWSSTGRGGKARGDDELTVERCLAAGGRLIVLEDSLKKLIVGTSWLTHDSRRVYLHHFGILSEYQGRGLSHLLLKESLLFAKKEGMQIKIEVHNSNEVALNLYKQAGFKLLGDYVVFIIRDIEDIVISNLFATKSPSR